MSFTKKINVNDGSGREFEDITTSEVVYDATPQLGSFNPVTSDGVARAISGASGEVPVINPGDDGKVLTAVDGAAAWAEAQGGSSYTAGDGISLFNDKIAVKHDSTISEITAPTTYNTGDDTRYNWNPIVPLRQYTAVKVKLGSVSDTATFATNTFSEYIDVCLPQTTEDPGLNGQYVKMVLANPSDRSKYVVGTVKSTATIEQSYSSSYQYYTAKIASSLSWTGTLSTMFDWGQLGVEDLTDSDGYIDLYFVACDSAGNVLTTGTYGPTDSMFVLGFVYNGLKVDVALSSDTKTLRVTNAVPGIYYETRGKVLKSTWSGSGGEVSMEWDYATKTSGVISGDGSLSDPYKLDRDSTLSENNDVIRISGGDGVSFDDTSYAYSISITEEQAAALNAAMDLNGAVKVKLSFASTPVMKLTSATSSQCYLHIGCMTGFYSYAGVSRSIGTTDQNGELVADLSDVTVSVVNSFAEGTCYIWVSTDSSKQATPGQDYFGTKLSFTSDGTTPIAADISVGKQVTRLSVANPVPDYTTSEDGKVLGVVDNAGTASLQWVSAGGGDQPLPAIPAYSIRFQFSDTSFDPTTPLAVTNGTWSPVDAGSGIWDFTYQNSDWNSLFYGIITSSNVNGTVDIIGGNMSGVSTATRLFKDCSSLANVRIVSPWGDGNTELDLSYMLEHSGATEIYLDMSGSNSIYGAPYFSYMAHECSSLKKFTLENPGLHPRFGHILHDCFALREATIEGFDEISNAEAMFTSSYNLAKITLTPTQPAIKVNTSAESMFYRTGSAVETIEYPFDLNACNTARGMFAQCTIGQLPVLLNTGNVGDFSSFCDTATELRSIPYIDVTNAYAVEQMFYGCTNVQSGALALYQQLSTKSTPLTYYSACFSNCGSSTVSGTIELAKIPAYYGGLGYESASSASVELLVNDLVVNDSVDVTSITVYSGVTSGIVQWTVASTTTLPTVVDSSNNPLKASVNNPASLTVGRTVQVSILNGTWVCAEFA